MKKKINIFCVLIFVAVAFSIAMSFYNGRREYIHDFIMLITDIDTTTSDDASDDPWSFTSVDVVPKNMDKAYSDSIYNKVTGKYDKCYPTTINVSKKNYDLVSDDFWWFLADFLISLYAFFIFDVLFNFVGMIKKVNQEEIFDDVVVKYLHDIGMYLLMLFGCGIISDYACYRSLCMQFDWAEYDVFLHFGNYSLELITGISLLLLAEIFDMAIEMKEDQELTI